MLAEMHYGWWLPPMLTTHGDQIDRLINIVHYFMALLFVGWGIFYVYCLFNFRARAGHKARYLLPQGKIVKAIEVGVLGFEIIILVAVSMPVWADYKDKPPTPDQNPLIVHVGAKQFEWHFHYAGPDGVFGRLDPKLISSSNPMGLDDSDPASKDDLVLVNEFHAPTGRPVRLEITSRDVIHSFFIPSMRVKQDAIPGMRIPIWFTINEDATTEHVREQMTRSYEVSSMAWDALRHHIACEDYKDKAGVVILAKGADLGTDYKLGAIMIDKLKAAGISEVRMQPRNPLEVVCAQLCGNNHYTMKAQMITHTKEEFDEWQTKAIADKAKGPDLGF